MPASDMQNYTKKQHVQIVKLNYTQAQATKLQLAYVEAAKPDGKVKTNILIKM